MSNHVHFILDCSEGLAIEFIVLLKMRFGLYLQRRYGTREILKRNNVDIQKLTLENESLERAVAYIHMNSVAAGICINLFKSRPDRRDAKRPLGPSILKNVPPVPQG